MHVLPHLLSMHRLNFVCRVFQFLSVDRNLPLAQVVTEVDGHKVNPAILERKEMRSKMLPVEWFTTAVISTRKLLNSIRRIRVVSRDTVVRHVQVIHDSHVFPEVSLSGFR